MNELEGEFTSSASGDRLSYVRRFILLFRNSPILLEDSYYNRYTILIEQANRPDTSEDFPEFMDLLHEVRATERTLVPAYGPAKDTVDAIPKVVQSRLASNVLYFRSFMTSREPKIALKILEGALNQRIIAEVLGSRAANSELLDKIISMPKYLETPAAQKALLFNPHAHRRYVRTALRYLDNLGNHDVIRLANSHDVASEIRQAAKRLATTRGLPGLGKRV